MKPIPAPHGGLSPTHRIQAEGTSRLIFLLLTSPLAVLGLIASVKSAEADFLLVVLFVVLFPQLWLCCFEIVLHEDKMSYRTLFAGRREVLFTNITRAKTEVGMGAGFKGRTQPFYRLVLFDMGRFARDPLIINMKPFSRSDLARVAQALVKNASSAKIDKSVVSLSQGSIKHLTHEASKQIWQAAMLIFVVFLLLGLVRALFTGVH